MTNPNEELNQYTVTIHKKADTPKCIGIQSSNQINFPHLLEVKDLNLYSYLAQCADDSKLEFSPKTIEDTLEIDSSKCCDQFTKLVYLGFLVPSSMDYHFDFYELPQASFE